MSEKQTHKKWHARYNASPKGRRRTRRYLEGHRAQISAYNRAYYRRRRLDAMTARLRKLGREFETCEDDWRRSLLGLAVARLKAQIDVLHLEAQEDAIERRRRTA